LTIFSLEALNLNMIRTVSAYVFYLESGKRKNSYFMRGRAEEKTEYLLVIDFFYKFKNNHCPVIYINRRNIEMSRLLSLLIWSIVLVRNIESIDVFLDFNTRVSFTTGIRDTARLVNGTNIVLFILFENNTICAYNQNYTFIQSVPI
jgi:hypothetical protein